MSTREQALRVAGGRPKGRRAKDLTKQWVHVSINRMKQTLSVGDFVVWCERVTAFAYASKKRESA